MSADEQGVPEATSGTEAVVRRVLERLARLIEMQSTRAANNLEADYPVTAERTRAVALMAQSLIGAVMADGLAARPLEETLRPGKGAMEQMLKGPDFGTSLLDSRMIRNTEAAPVAAGEEMKERPKPTTFEGVESEKLLDELTDTFTAPELLALVKEELRRRLAKAESAGGV